MVAVTQIRYRHSPGRAYYEKKLAEAKTPKEALRALKRQVSDAIFACLQADARRAAAAAANRPGGQPGNHSATRAAGRSARATPPRRAPGQCRARRGGRVIPGSPGPARRRSSGGAGAPDVPARSAAR